MKKWNINNILLGYYSNNKFINEAFKSLTKKLSGSSHETLSGVLTVTDDMFNLLSEINLNKLFISLTPNNSVLFRFSVDKSDLEFRFEVFYDFDENDEEDIQSTLHVYNKDIKEGAYYGSMAYLFSVVKELLPECNFVYEIIFTNSGVGKLAISQGQKYPLSDSTYSNIQPPYYPTYNFFQQTILR